jgi:hypothetical protein
LAGDPRDEVPGWLFADPRAKPGDAADPIEGLQWLALRAQCLAASPGKRALAQLGVERPALVLFGDGRKAHDLPILLRQHVANKIVTRVKPEGRLSCSRCIIRTMEPVLVPFSRL